MSDDILKRLEANRMWMREQIAFAIWNSTNPPNVRDRVTLKTIGGNPTVTHAIGGGWKASLDLGQEWSCNRASFLKLADVAIAAFEAADADGSAYV